MWDENVAFSRRMHTIEGQIKSLKKAADTLIASSEKVLSSQLPQDYALGETGEVAPVAGSGQPLITAGQLPRTKSMELATSVLNPLSAWQTEHTRLKGRMSELDRASLLLDEARRRHYKGAERELKENVMKQDNVGAHQTRETEDPQLVSARGAFMRLEGEVHQELQSHALNARDAQHYITRAMELQGQRLQEAAKVHAQPGGGAVPVGAAPMGGAPVGGMQTGGMQTGSMPPQAAARY